MLGDNKQARVGGPQLAGRYIEGQQVEEVLGTCVMKGLVGEQESLENNPELYRQPVQQGKMGGDVFMFFLHLVMILAVAF